jgi:hypothetical protein
MRRADLIDGENGESCLKIDARAAQSEFCWRVAKTRE